MSDQGSSASKAQRERFIGTAHALDSDEDEAAFKEKLAVIARQKLKEKNKLYRKRKSKMALFRVETVEDVATGIYGAEVYYPENASEPYIVTPARHPSHDAALQFVVETFKRGMPEKNVQVKDDK